MQDASTLTGQARRGADRRQAIVEAASEVFATRGFRGSALTDVAQKVGVTPANLLYHFGSKEGLLLAVIGERDLRASADMAQLPPEGGLRSLRGILRFAEQGEGEPGLAALHTVLQIESVDPDTPAHGYFRDRSRYLREWGERTLEAAKAAGEIRADVDCGRRAVELLAFVEGATVIWLIDDQVSLVQLYRDFLDDFIASIATEGDE